MNLLTFQIFAIQKAILPILFRESSFLSQTRYYCMNLEFILESLFKAMTPACVINDPKPQLHFGRSKKRSLLR